MRNDPWGMYMHPLFMSNLSAVRMMEFLSIPEVRKTKFNHERDHYRLNLGMIHNNKFSLADRLDISLPTRFSDEPVYLSELTLVLDVISKSIFSVILL